MIPQSSMITLSHVRLTYFDFPAVSFHCADALMGIAIVGGAALALGGLIGLGVAALKKK